MKTLKLAFTISLFLFSHLLLCPWSLFASKAEIVELTVTNKQEYIFIDAKLQGAFTDKINEAISSGIPTTFKYYLELKDPRLLWFDKKIVKKLIKHQVIYDTLKKEYQIIIKGGHSPIVKVTKKEDEMRKWMTSINSFPFVSSKKVAPINKHRIRLKAEMKCIKMPFPLNYLLFYISFWDFDTSWVSSPIPEAIK